MKRAVALLLAATLALCTVASAQDVNEYDFKDFTTRGAMRVMMYEQTCLSITGSINDLGVLEAAQNILRIRGIDPATLRFSGPNITPEKIRTWCEDISWGHEWLPPYKHGW